MPLDSSNIYLEIKNNYRVGDKNYTKTLIIFHLFFEVTRNAIIQPRVLKIKLPRSHYTSIVSPHFSLLYRS